MRKALVASLLSVILVLPGTAVQAGGYHHGHDDDLLIAAGIIGGAFLLGSLLTQPRYYAPPVYYPRPPVYYAPRRAPNCHQDRVYRYLPDGRIQWGTRTHCY